MHFFFLGKVSLLKKFSFPQARLSFEQDKRKMVFKGNYEEDTWNTKKIALSYKTEEVDGSYKNPFGQFYLSNVYFIV